MIKRIVDVGEINIMIQRVRRRLFMLRATVGLV